MEVLSSRVLLLSADPERLQAFYRDQLGLPIHREYPPGGIVFFAGNGLIEISSHMKTDAPDPSSNAALWLQVRDAEATEKQFRDRGVSVTREPRTETWGPHRDACRGPPRRTRDHRRGDPPRRSPVAQGHPLVGRPRRW